MAYGKKIDDLRRKYKAYLWDGAFRDTLGAEVSANGPFSIQCSSQRTASGQWSWSTRAPMHAITAKVNLPNPGKLIVATPEQPDGKPTNGTLEVPARSAAVLIEV